MTMVACVKIGYSIFIQILQTPTQPWHILLKMVLGLQKL